jgi:hypothetical protein
VTTRVVKYQITFYEAGEGVLGCEESRTAIQSGDLAPIAAKLALLCQDIQREIWPPGEE